MHIRRINRIYTPKKCFEVEDKTISAEIIFNEITNLDFSKATSLTSIGDSAFYSNKLTSVKFGTTNSLTEIGSGSFCNQDCSIPTYDKTSDSVTTNNGFEC